MPDTIGIRIKKLREIKKLKQKEFAKIIDVSQGTLSDIENGKFTPSVDTIISVSRYMNVSTDWLLKGDGHESKHAIKDEIAELISQLTVKEKSKLEDYIEFLLYCRVKKGKNKTGEKPLHYYIKEQEGRNEDEALIPLVGDAAAGQPLHMNENHNEFVTVDKEFASIRAFTVRVVGDSMTGAGINHGDLVIIRPQPVVEQGEPALVRINDEATIKYLYRSDNHLVLRSANPHYKPIKVGPNQNVAVVGKVVKVIKKEEVESRLHNFFTE